jgi:hypothetical protein
MIAAVAAALCANPVRAAAAATGAYLQSDATVTLAPREAHRLALYFTPPYPSGPAPAPVANALAAGASPQMRHECAALVARFASGAGGTSRVSVTILGIGGSAVWLAYRCASDAPQLERYYSERVAVLSARRGALRFVALGQPHDSAATLYHAGFDKELKLESATAAGAFLIFATRDAPGATIEDRYVVIADRPAGARVVLSIAIERHGGARGGAGYHATLRFDHTIAGDVTGVTAYSRETAGVGAPRFAVARYRWEPAAFAFERQAREIAPGGESPESAPNEQLPRVLPPVPGYPLAN